MMRNDRGFALLAALGLLVLLSAVGLEFSLRARERRLTAVNLLEGDRAAAAADAGIAQTYARLAQRLARAGTIDPWADDGWRSADTVSVGDGRYAVTVDDPTAKLHLNRATEDELRRLFFALRIDAGRADRLAQTILDWRDADDLHRARGAECDDYRREGALLCPANAPFASVEEVRYVKGMTAELYRHIAPSLTVLGTGQVNLNAASAPVLLALPGMTEQAVAVLQRHRAGMRPIRSLEELSLELPPGPRAILQAATLALLPRVSFETRELVVTSDGWSDGSPVHARVAALFARGGDHVVLAWRRSR